jgi:hypothetical protein
LCRRIPAESAKTNLAVSGFSTVIPHPSAGKRIKAFLINHDEIGSSDPKMI